jgi:hypothetical protein
MILQEQGDQIVVVRQTDHALLAGFLASQWGNETFARPELFESFCLAAREHDNGWAEWEIAPRIDPKTRLPYTFMSIPTEEHVALYERGIERVAGADPYAGVLVSLHCTGLYDRARATLPGFSAKYVKSQEMPLVNQFLQHLKLQQLRLKTELRMNPATKALADEKALGRNTALIDALDRLSLYFCLQAGEDACIEGVPANQGTEVDWQIRWQGEQQVSLAPYPFRRDPLSVGVLARRMPKRMYGDQADFHKELVRAPYFAVNFTVCSGGRLGVARAAT